MTARLALIPLLAAEWFGCGYRPVTLTVSAAASLQDAMEELARSYETAHPGVSIAFNFGGSGTLEQQIENGAPVDVFLSAASKPMDQLASKGMILAGARRDIVRNQLVLIAPKDTTQPASFADLRGGGVRLVALGNPGSVPAGDYARQALTQMGLWDAVQPKLSLAKDVRQVLSYVETGNADAGLVYATDARESGKVRVVGVAPEDSHAPIVYPIAVMKSSRYPAESKAFVVFLAAAAARDVLARHGFTPVAP